MPTPSIENRSFLALLVFISIAFIWLMLPFYGAIFWGVILAILFSPVQKKLTVIFGQRENLAAITTLLIILVMVIIPAAFLLSSLIKEGMALYQRVSSGEQNFGMYVMRVVNAMPASAQQFLIDMELVDAASIQDKLSEWLMQTTQFWGTKALALGQNTLTFAISFAVMLYLLFFLLRDGAALTTKVQGSIPLGQEYRQHFMEKFITVIKATVKGNLIIALIQGIIGGVTFALLGVKGALLWGFVMTILSLLPAVGASLIWGPVAIYFFVTGAIWQAVVLTLIGVLIIGLIDNLLRPVLVGKDTKLPDYVILISTLGGLKLFGLNGFVIGPLIAAIFIAAWSLFTDKRATA